MLLNALLFSYLQFILPKEVMFVIYLNNIIGDIDNLLIFIPFFARYGVVVWHFRYPKLKMDLRRYWR